MRGGRKEREGGDVGVRGGRKEREGRRCRSEGREEGERGEGM